MYEVVSNEIFPFIKNLHGKEESVFKYMRGATFLIPTPNMLAKIVDGIDNHPTEDRDAKGDLYEYLLSKPQFITDVIRLGFDGVIFNSSVGNDFNVVVFALDNIDYIEGTGKVFEVDSLKYRYTECRVENFLTMLHIPRFNKSLI
jgi:type I restriction-modification system DNA methylase subunit